jgi:hypothetical protein
MTLTRHEAEAQIMPLRVSITKRATFGQRQVNGVTLFGCILPRGCGIEITILRPMVLGKSRKAIFLQRLGSFLPLKVSFLIEPQVKIRYFPDVIPTVAGVQKQ